MKPLKIGLTGGIGSGKTTVANLFKELEIPVYIADVEAKKLMITSKVLIRQLKKLFGDLVYINGELNKDLVRAKIFEDKSFLKEMNAIVHPKVARHFKKWYIKQNSQYIISESALIFENNIEDRYHFVITVTAPEDLKINRVISRDNSDQKRVKAIIKNQLDDKVKTEKADFVITNIDLENTKKQVLECHKQILNFIEKT